MAFCPNIPAPTRCAIPRSRLPHGFSQMVGTGRKMDLPFGANPVRRENEGRRPVTRLPPVDPSTVPSFSQTPFPPPWRISRISASPCLSLSLDAAEGPLSFPRKLWPQRGSWSRVSQSETHNATRLHRQASQPFCKSLTRPNVTDVTDLGTVPSGPPIRSIPANTPVCVF